ncbi:MAG: GNAT family N-acetyltransferase [Planctomycetaceae bacterium]|nr:GNAT family N-acetyltransferase [Planctomycetaceae bacterium]
MSERTLSDWDTGGPTQHSVGAPTPRGERRLRALLRLRRAAELRSRRAVLFELQSGLHLAERELPPRAAPELLAVLPAAGALCVLGDGALGTTAAARLFALVRQGRPDAVLLAPDPDGATRRRGGWIAAWVGPRGWVVQRTQDPKSKVARVVAEGRTLVLLAAPPRTHELAVRRADGRLHPLTAQLAAASGAPLVPVHLAATGYRFSLKRGRRRAAATTWHLRVGRPLAPARLAHLFDGGRLLDYLRLRLFALGFSGAAARRRARGAWTGWLVRPRAALAPVPAADVPERLEDELARLPTEQRLVEQGSLVVYLFRADEAPRTLREVGRLREIAFRAVGEGSGLSLDLDRFDRFYHHLIVWDREARVLVGAYRLAGTDEVLAHSGLAGLYTRTLFHFDESLVNALGPALELGRSFVRPEYQRTYAPLLLLWRGIGAYLVANPRYRRLFGAVSITDHYQPLSQALMVQYLRTHRLSEELAPRVASLRPFPSGGRRLGGVGRDLWEASLSLGDVEELSGLVSDIEGDRKGVPVLLREYLKLGGRVLGFNVDASFSDVLDALVVIELEATDPRVLRRYLGDDGLASFLAADARA